MIEPSLPTEDNSVSSNHDSRHLKRAQSLIAREDSVDDILQLLSTTSVRKDSISSGASSASPATSPLSITKTCNSSPSERGSNAPVPILRRTSSYVSIESANKSLDASVSKSGSVRRRGIQITITGLDVITDDAPPHHEQEEVPVKISTSVPVTNMKRSGSMVSFNSVDVRDYDVTLGDNPSVGSGPAIALDWSYHERPRISVDEYETSFRDQSRLHKEPKRLAPGQREKILKNGLGFTDEQLQEAEKETKKIQRERGLSSALSSFWRVESAFDSIKERMQKNRENRKGKKAVDPLA